MKKTWITVMGLLFVAAVSTSAFASNWGRGPGYDGAQGRGYGNAETFRGMAGLNLSAEQTAKLAEIRNARTRELMPIQEKMLAKRNAIKALWLDKTPNQEKIIAAQKELGDLRDQMQAKTTESRLESLKALTPAQQEIVKAQYSGSRRGARDGRRAPAQGRAGKFGFGPDCLRNR